MLSNCWARSRTLGTPTWYPFHRRLGLINIWNAAHDTKYTYRCAGPFAQQLVAHVIRDGFDMASSTELKGWEWGLPHAHINPLTLRTWSCSRQAKEANSPR